jgi:hypothetical protein
MLADLFGITSWRSTEPVRPWSDVPHVRDAVQVSL